MNKSHITEEQKNKWRKMADEGMTITDIAKKEGYTRKTIRTAIGFDYPVKRQYGKKAYKEDDINKMRELRLKGYYINEISKELGISEGTVSKYVSDIESRNGIKESKFWSEEDIHYVINYYKDTTMTDLAYALDKKKSQIQHKVIWLIRNGYVESKRGVGR